jgi:hypothetical protein
MGKWALAATSHAALASAAATLWHRSCTSISGDQPQMFQESMQWPI